MMHRKWLALLLTLLLAVPLLAGCKGEEQPGSNSAVSETSGGPTYETTPPRYDGNANILDTLPEGHYGGKDFAISVYDGHYYQFDAERPNGDLINDTLYNWMDKIEGRYDVVLDVRKSGDWGSYYGNITTEILAGLDVANLYGTMAFQHYSGVINGLFQNWLDISDMIDLEAERWDQDVNNEVTYNDVLYGLTGNLGVSKLQYTMATFYNTEMMNAYGYTTDRLVQLVDDGDWTFEAFSTVVKDIYTDLDASGTVSEGDVFGYIGCEGNSFDIWFPSFNIQITSRDVDNTITPTLYTESNATVLGMLCDFYHDNEGVRIFDVTQYSSETLFANRQAAMVSTRFYAAYTSYSDMGSEAYGILPTPKLNSEQEHYISKLNDQYTIWCVAKSLPDSERDFTAHITDALCAESSTTVYYQFYDVILKNRYSKDPDTARMVDLIMDHVSFDTAIMYGEYLDGYPYMIRELIKADSTDIASLYAGKAESIAQKLQTVYDSYKPRGAA